uniref:CC domain-containing protein n=1 Tax=Panagrellus redivivus TaxID=6233 RepID=A0A7E4W4L3_PANRE
MNYSLVIAYLLTIASYVAAQNTPVIGGACKQGTADVQIGGKQTQFFLKCEANDDSESGNGIWVVKSRAQAMAPSSNDAQQHPKKLRKMQMTNVCEQDSTAREGQSCTTSETCLQQNYEHAGSYLQCDSTQQRWVKRNCQQDFTFSFEHQSCIGHTKTIRHVARQASNGGVICTFTSCSNNNPCNIGTCNNGYCCSSAPVAPITVSGSCPSCNNNNGPRIISIPTTASNSCSVTCPRGYASCCGSQSASCCLKKTCPSPVASTVTTTTTRRACFTACPQGQSCVSGVCCSQAVPRCPGGGMPYGTCNNGFCSAGYNCIQSTNMCCANIAIGRIVSTCPGGRLSTGSCNNGRCGSGYSCQQNQCCPTQTTVCADGTQAAGSCVNGQCGTGFTCTNNLCCTSSSSTPRCLDGSSAVGACISGRCGSGYTCTTGNICCPSTTSVCPVGQVSIGRCVNNQCPTGYTCTGTYPNNYCCGTESTAVTCDVSESAGPCINGECGDGYSCDTTNDLCCPLITDVQIGPCIDGACPVGYLCVTDICYERSDSDTSTVCDGSVGPCIAGACPAGYTCTNGNCCP